MLWICLSESEGQELRVGYLEISRNVTLNYCNCSEPNASEEWSISQNFVIECHINRGVKGFNFHTRGNFRYQNSPRSSVFEVLLEDLRVKKSMLKFRQES